MHAVVRNYSGSDASELFDELQGLLGSIEEAIRSISGVVAYTLLRTTNHGISITVCENKTGADESVTVAAKFINGNCSTVANPPEISEGATMPNIN